MALLDRCIFQASAGGVVDFAIASNIVGYQTPAAAGGVNGLTYHYAAQSADLSQWEVGTGTYNMTGPVLARTTVLFNSLGTTAKISFSAAPQVMISALAEDFNALTVTTKAGTVVPSDLPVGVAEVINDTVNRTTKLYANVNGVLKSSLAETGSINVGDIVQIYPDGVTDNQAPGFDTFCAYLPTVGKTFPAVVTISIGTPAIISWPGHGLGVNSQVIFQTTGALPLPFVAGQVYYVISLDLTLDQFCVSSHNALIRWDGEGVAINTGDSDPLVPDYVNLGGTGDRRLIIAVSSSGLGLNGPPSNFVNGLYDNVDFFGVSSSGNLRFDFGVGASKRITEFKWYQDAAIANGTWNFSGSNDGTSWTAVASNFVLGSSATTTISFTNTNGYRYYSLDLTGATPTSGGPFTKEIEFKICDTATPTQSGVHKAQVTGTDWINVSVPPGNYHVPSSGFAVSGFVTANGAKKVRLSAYGAVFDGGTFGSPLFIDVAFTSGVHLSALIQNIAPNNSGVQTLTLITPADATKFRIGSWIMVCGLDMQGANSTPINNHYCEFVRITAINAGTGVITLDRRLRNGYRSTWPSYFAGDATTLTCGGPATIIQANDTWDQELEVYGLRITSTGQTPFTARSILIVDCIFDGQGPVPSGCKYYVAKRCVWGSSSGAVTSGNTLEIDKLCEYVEFNECWGAGFFVQSTSVDRLVVDSCNFESVGGTARNTYICNSDIQSLLIGPLFFGASETVLIENSRIGSIQAPTRLDDAGAAARASNRVSNWVFNAGTLRCSNNSGSPKGPVVWAIPGRKMFVNDMAGFFDSMGSPFIVLDVYQDATFTYIDTTLAALPVGISTNSTITMSSASPAVVGWTAHGLTAGTGVMFDTTGVLPLDLATGQPVKTGTIYYVIAAGLGANVFEFSSSIGGAAVNTSNPQSGTHRAEANGLHFQVQSCPRVTVKNCTGCTEIVDLSDGPDDVPLWCHAKRTYAGYIGQ